MATERKEKLIRVLQLMEATDEKSPMNATQLVEKLDDQFTLGDVDRRSIYRDISMLQYCGYQISQCKDKRKGWYMEKHAFDDWEIKIMMDSILQAKCITPENAKSIRGRLLSLSSDRGRKRFAHQIMPKSMNMAADQMMGEYIEIMLEAMYAGKQIAFQYTELNDCLKPVIKRDGHIYKLSLYTLVWSDNTYYLIGAHDNHSNLTNYRLDRIRNLHISEDKIIPAKDKVGDNPELVIQDYVKKSVDHFAGEPIRVEVEYTPNSINHAILYDFAGGDISVRTSGDKSIARFTKMDSVTLIGWLTQYATRFKVVAPEELKQEVVEELKKGLANYI